MPMWIARIEKAINTFCIFRYFNENIDWKRIEILFVIGTKRNDDGNLLTIKVSVEYVRLYFVWSVIGCLTYWYIIERKWQGFFQLTFVYVWKGSIPSFTTWIRRTMKMRHATVRILFFRNIDRPVQAWRNHVFSLCIVNNSVKRGRIKLKFSEYI